MICLPKIDYFFCLSFVGQPIQCWFPAYYRGWWMEYALDYCFVQNTYFVAFTEVKPDSFFDIAEHIIPIPKNYTERDEKQLGESFFCQKKNC